MLSDYAHHIRELLREYANIALAAEVRARKKAQTPIGGEGRRSYSRLADAHANAAQVYDQAIRKIEREAAPEAEEE